MKRLVQVCLVLALAVTLVFGLLQTVANSPMVTRPGCNNVGWNSFGCTATVAYQILPPTDTPNVGWNSDVG